MSQKDRISPLNVRVVAAFAALTPGAEVRCPHCRSCHVVQRRHAEGTEYARSMLYFVCDLRGGFYFAGTEGTPSRHETRPAATRKGA